MPRCRASPKGWESGGQDWGVCVSVIHRAGALGERIGGGVRAPLGLESWGQHWGVCSVLHPGTKGVGGGGRENVLGLQPGLN